MQAEQVGEDGGGELGGEVEEGGASAGLGEDAEGPEPSAECVGGDGASGQVPGEQPGGLLRGADAAVAAAVADQLEDGAGERAGDGASWRPRRRKVWSSWRVTWLVVMAAMRDSGWP